MGSSPTMHQKEQMDENSEEEITKREGKEEKSK